MRKLKGKLLYTGAKWSRFPWRLEESEFVEIHLLPAVDRFFASLNGRPARHRRERDSYTLTAGEPSRLQFEHLDTYVHATLIRLSGRMVAVEIEDGERLMFTADPTEEVLRLDSSGKIPDGAEQTNCRIGRRDRCVFLSERDGFFCRKFTRLESIEILERLKPDVIRALRIGSCALL